MQSEKILSVSKSEILTLRCPLSMQEVSRSREGYSTVEAGWIDREEFYFRDSKLPQTLPTTKWLRWTRSWAVAVIADRTAYDVRHTGKQTGFGYKFTDDCYARSDLTGIEFMNAPKLYLLKRDHWAWQTKVQ